MAKGKYKKKNQTSAEAEATAPKQEAQAPVMPRSESGKLAEKNLIDLDFERQAAENASGMEETTYGVWRYVYKANQLINRYRKPHTFKKKTYLWLMLFTGVFGGHRWYQGRYILAALSTLFFWTGVPTILMVTDFMEVFPIKADENGYITMR